MGDGDGMDGNSHVDDEVEDGMNDKELENLIVLVGRACSFEFGSRALSTVD
jgi:hypothetical protein